MSGVPEQVRDGSAVVARRLHHGATQSVLQCMMLTAMWHTLQQHCNHCNNFVTPLQQHCNNTAPALHTRRSDDYILALRNQCCTA
mmetsp:Transcript_63271/g.53640  ORF Transcript_63271/g.53640 Transcript_63271/m.53640 type:complete len:85 (-) Transcript_63271:75-329(-)